MSRHAFNRYTIVLMAVIHQSEARYDARYGTRRRWRSLGGAPAAARAWPLPRGASEALAPSAKLQVSNQTLQGLLTRVKHGPNRGATLVVVCEAAWPGCGRLLLPGPLHLLRATRPPCASLAPPPPHAPPLKPSTTPPRIRLPILRVLHFAASFLLT